MRMDQKEHTHISQYVPSTCYRFTHIGHTPYNCSVVTMAQPNFQYFKCFHLKETRLRTEVNALVNIPKAEAPATREARITATFMVKVCSVRNCVAKRGCSTMKV